MKKPKQKFKVPQISPEAMTPQIAELVAFAEQLVKSVQDALAQRRALKQEIARLKRAKRASSHWPK